MRVCMYSTKPYDEASFTRVNEEFGHEIEFLEDRLRGRSAPLAEGAEAVCVFVNDVCDARVLGKLHHWGVRIIALRAAGFNNVDIEAAAHLGMTVVRVPAYSPHAVAEHTIALILALNRKIHRAFNRVRELDFSLAGLLGFDMYAKTAGVIGTGRIGAIVARLLQAFGCEVLAFDPYPNPDLAAAGVAYVERDDLFRRSDVIVLTAPLTDDTYHIVRAETLELVRPGVMIVNTGRGGLIDTPSAIEGLKSGRIGSLALDVYEEEASLFFEDRSNDVLADDVFARLLTFPNVLITAHQAFFTAEALDAIARTTLQNLSDLEAGRPCPNVVEP